VAVANGRITAVIAAISATGVALTLGARAEPAAGHAIQAAPGGAAVTAAGRASAPATGQAARARKGAGIWVFNGVHRALIQSRVSWYYTWGPDHHGITSPRGVAFVPMIWGAGSVTNATLREVKHEGQYLLGFNEPDLASQANMTVSRALNLWPRLMSTGMRLGSPAVATGAATRGGWLDRFMRGAAARHYRVSFITVHWYGGDFVASRAVAELKSYLKAIHARYHRPLWLTEFALPATAGDGTAGLFRPGAVATRAGRAFEVVHR
jgi:putative glycosyl hydrolase